MKFWLLNILLMVSSASLATTPKVVDYNTLLSSDKIKLNKSDVVLAEHMVKMLKFTDKGYINQDILNMVLKETEKSKNFKPFLPWLQAIKKISLMNKTEDLIAYCQEFRERKEKLSLEKSLESSSGNYCRERALEAIGRDIDKNQQLSEEATLFIQQNLKYFLTKKNRKNFAFFVQSQAQRPEILKKLSQEVTSYSVQNEIVPSHEVLKDILINEQITRLIQDKGFNPLQHQNVFYSEYGKLIEQSYKTLNDKPELKKVKEHFVFLKNYLELNQDHLPVGLCLNRLNDFGKAVFRNGLTDLSRDIFKYIVKKNNKDVHEDALFFYFWSYVSLDEFKDANKFAKKYDLLKEETKIQDARLKFWLAFMHEKLDEKPKAISIYEDLVVNSPLSYYGIMAYKKLAAIKPDSQAVNFYKTKAAPPVTSISIDLDGLDDDYLASLVRLRAWAKIDSIKFMKLEIKRIRNFSMPAALISNPTEKQLAIKSDMHLLNAKLIQDSQNHLGAFRYLYEVLDRKEVVFNRPLLEVLYPQPYLDVLSSTLKKDDLDPIVVLSLIRQESVFNPLARSSVGARGLMQLMPATARRMQRSVRDSHLVNPKINIKLGTKYFKNLFQRYDGNLVYVLAAYNAGEGRVERWKNQYFDADETIIKNIEAIPFLETRNYVKLIFRNIFFYKLLNDQKKELADNGELNQIFDVKLGFKK